MAAAVSHLSGGSAKRQREEEEQAAMDSGDPNNKRRRKDILGMDNAAIRDCINLRKTNIEFRGAIKHILSCTLEGGLQVMMSKVQIYPGYDEDCEVQLVQNLQRALEWRLTLGFVLVFIRRRPVYIYYDDSDDSDDMGALIEAGYNDEIDTAQPDSIHKPPIYRDVTVNHSGKNGGDDDAMDTDDNDAHKAASELIDMLAEGVSPKQPRRRIVLDKEDIEFIVPSLGYGEFRAYLDTESMQYKVDYIRTEDEKKDENLACFVYTEEEPIYRRDEKGTTQPTVWPCSPASRLIKHAGMLDGYLMDDEKGTRLATNPIPVAQERPPVKQNASLASGSQYSYAGMGMPAGLVTPGSVGLPANAQQQMGKPHVVFEHKEPSQPTPRAPAITSDTVQDIARRTYYIEDGYTYAGLVTPHAYPSISVRRTDYLTLVSMETRVPMHVIQPGKTVGDSSSSAMTGSAAGGKRPQAAGDKNANPAQPKASKSSGGFNADPSFNTALEMRDFLQSFFQAMMRIKNGEKFRLYALQELESNDTQLQLKRKLAEDLEEHIRAAEKGVADFGNTMSDQQALRQETQDLVSKAQHDSFKPDAIAKANKPVGESGKAPGPVQLPEAPPAPDAGNEQRIPVAPEVATLTQRRLEIENDMRAITAAHEQYRKMMSTERPVSLQWRQPIVNDTSNIENVINLLGLPPEQSKAIALRRFGLLS